MEIIGHRGASHDAPENTLAAVNLAWLRGADAVEVDVFQTKDGKIVAIHDATTKRYGGPDRKISDQTLKELKLLDVGGWKDKKYAGERIPTLDEVLATIPKGNRLYVEIKTGKEIVPELHRVLKQWKRQTSEVALIGFSWQTMALVKKTLPQHAAYWVVRVEQEKKSGIWKPNLSGMIAEAKKAGLDGLHLGNSPAVINRDYAQQIKKAGLGLFVWTVNSPDDARRLLDAGVDGITTDRPGWMKMRLAADRNRIDVEQSGSFCQHRETTDGANTPVASASKGPIP